MRTKISSFTSSKNGNFPFKWSVSKSDGNAKEKDNFSLLYHKNLNANLDEKIQKLQKKIGDSRIPEGIWSLETIRRRRG